VPLKNNKQNRINATAAPAAMESSALQQVRDFRFHGQAAKIINSLIFEKIQTRNDSIFF
jgi:hypothetical protein